MERYKEGADKVSVIKNNWTPQRLLSLVGIAMKYFLKWSPFTFWILSIITILGKWGILDFNEEYVQFRP